MSVNDIIVVLVITLLVASVGGALVHARHVTRGDARQPGMGSGEDPIWSRIADDDPAWDWVVGGDPTWSRVSGDT